MGSSWSKKDHVAEASTLPTKEEVHEERAKKHGLSHGLTDNYAHGHGHIGHGSPFTRLGKIFNLEHYPATLLLLVTVNVIFMTLVYPKYTPKAPPKGTVAAVSSLELPPRDVQLAEAAPATDPEDDLIKQTPWQASRNLQVVFSVLILFAMVHDGSSRFGCGGDGTKTLRGTVSRYEGGKKHSTTFRAGGGAQVVMRNHGESFLQRVLHFKLSFIFIFLLCASSFWGVSTQKGKPTEQKITSYVNLIFSVWLFLILITGRHEIWEEANMAKMFQKKDDKTGYNRELTQHSVLESDPFGLLGRHAVDRDGKPIKSWLHFFTRLGKPLFTIIRVVEESGGFRWMILFFLLVWNLMLLTGVTLSTQGGKTIGDADKGKDTSDSSYKTFRGVETAMLFLMIIGVGVLNPKNLFTSSRGSGCHNMGKGSLNMGHDNQKWGGWGTKAPLLIILVMAVGGLVYGGYPSFIADIFLVALLAMGMARPGDGCKIMSVKTGMSTGAARNKLMNSIQAATRT